MKLLVTGGCGFLGSNIAHHQLEAGNEVVVFDNLYRPGTSQNLEWLKQAGLKTFAHGDIRNREDIEQIIKTQQPDVIFHLAGQVAMTTSILRPRFDFEVNVLGSLNVLESVRLHSPDSIVVYSSTNKVYGQLEEFNYEVRPTRYFCTDYPNGFNELVRLDFHSPYGASKGAADQYMLDYARIYNLKTVVFRHSSIYGSRQFPTFDQGWIGWFCLKALEQRQNPKAEPFTISGNGKQVRDVLHAEDAVNCYLYAINSIRRSQGQVFNIGGGMSNSLSLLELFTFLEKQLGIELNYRHTPPRDSDQHVFVADIQKAMTMLQWKPRIGYEEGITKMLEWIAKIGFLG